MEAEHDTDFRMEKIEFLPKNQRLNLLLIFTAVECSLWCREPRPVLLIDSNKGRYTNFTQKMKNRSHRWFLRLGC